MFDFFKDVYYEANGFDMKLLKEEKKRKGKQKVIFDKKKKIIISAIAIIMLLCYMSALLLAVHRNDIMESIKIVFAIFLTFATMVCVLINNKSIQIGGIIGMAVIVIFTMLL